MEKIKGGTPVKRIIVGMTGASGQTLGFRLLEALHDLDDVETHLVMSASAALVFEDETGRPKADLCALADFVHDEGDLSASISSGSFKTDGMAVVPCSMKTLSGIAHAYDENLIIRAADVCLKEGRRCVLVPREMPMNRIHLANMLACADAGYVIMPPVFTFYNHPKTIEDQIDHFIGKVLMQFDLPFERFRPWTGRQS